jgi:predicted nucleic acid-binding protein
VSDFVVDASVAVKWCVAETDSPLADELSASRNRLFAPSLIVTEVANALSRKAIAGLMTALEARHYLRALPHYLDDIIAVNELIEPALENACALRHPIYDLIYLEAAQRLGAQLITADRKFVAKIAGTDFTRHVTLLSEWRPE